MKFLTVLSVLQIAAIAVLSFKFVALERTIDASSLTTSSAVVGEMASRPLPSAAQIPTQHASQSTSEQLREIVREELTNAVANLSQASAAHPSPAVADPAESSRKQEPDYQYQLATVQSEIDYHVSQGFISNRAMSNLQRQLAMLDQSGRKQMMRKLVKALNSGDLKGQL